MTNSTIQDYMRGKDVPSLRDLQCFVGMLQTGEATLKDFEAVGVNLEQVARRYGSANCWTGTSGNLASQLLGWINEEKAKVEK